MRCLAVHFHTNRLPPHRPTEHLGDAYVASQLLHYLLCCLLERNGQASAVVQKGKAIWRDMLSMTTAASSQEGPTPASSTSCRRLLHHRVTCQVGPLQRSCRPCCCQIVQALLLPDRAGPAAARLCCCQAGGGTVLLPLGLAVQCCCH
jgi:hypothetical protein